MEWIVEAETLSDLIDHGRYSVSSRPLIRCKDCKHYYFAENRIPQEQRYVCDLNDDRWMPDSFCSYGERREDGEIH